MIGFRSLVNTTILAVLTALLLTGCAATPTGSRGYLKLSQVATDAFESATVLPDHAYFTTGSAANPIAIIAIHSDYTLETNRWTSVAGTEKQLKDWVLMMTDFRGYGLWTYGSDILGPQGEYVGVWYTKWSNFTIVKLLEDNRVMVFPPETDSFYPRRPGFIFRMN